MSAAHLHADGNEVLRFVDPLFRYADEGTYANLRGFDQLDGKLPPKLIQPIKINGDLSILVEAATKAAERVANDKRPIVFCPPICTFSNPDGARSSDLANGLTLSVEIDDGDMQVARQKLEALLGPATIIVASGGDWIDPATGEVHPKLHLHWRLSEPTRDQDDHEKLRYSRDMAAQLVGADPTGKPVVHCLRWPGSWNRKAEPRLAKIVAASENSEINLNDAAERLEEAIEAAGLASVKSSQSGPTGADTDRMASAMGAIPNAGTDIHYNDWIRFGYAVHRSTAGTGLDIWDTWSQKSDKYNAAETEAAWRRIDHAVTSSRAPRTIGAGTIIFHAKAAGWKEPEHPASEPPSDETDPGYWAGLEEAAKAGPRTNVAVDEVVQRFNVKFMMVNEAGKAIIYQPTRDPVLKRRYFARLGIRDLKTLYMNEIIQIGTDANKQPIYRCVADVWLCHEKRRQYIEGVVFDPSMQSTPGVLNLWEGFAVKPAQGNWSLMQDHIHTVICDGDPILYDYLIGWLARMFQHPAEQGEVAVVMKGGEGTGKGTLAKVLMHIIGQHGIAISNAKHLIGNFNSHLRDAIFLFADEAFFAGDRAHIGVLKSLITEPYLTIEAKFANAIQTPNFLHVMMASNEDWVVPASLQSRRFFVLDVPAKVQRNHAYFAAIWTQMEAGGYAAMLHDLLAMDLATFDVRDVPTTGGLQQQRKLSLPVPESWWQDILHRGYVFQSKLGLEAVFAEWHEEVTTELLYASYTAFADRSHDRHPMSRETFGVFMTRMGCLPHRPRNGVIGEHIADVNNGRSGTTRKADVVRKPRATGYAIGTLAAARSAFTSETGLAVEWCDEDHPEP